MTTTTTSHRPPGKSRQREECQPETVEALDKSMIAELPASQISRMSCMELIRVIQGSALPLMRPEIQSHLEFYDRKTLERLAYLARRCCRNQGF
jgi:hypothetical protein